MRIGVAYRRVYALGSQLYGALRPMTAMTKEDAEAGEGTSLFDMGQCIGNLDIKRSHLTSQVLTGYQ